MAIGHIPVYDGEGHVIIKAISPPSYKAIVLRGQSIQIM